MEVVPVRALVALAFPLLCGCSVLQTSLDAAPSADPGRVYLGHSRVLASPREVSRYACSSGPVLCDQSAVNFDCRCP
ncbi:MAG TPA: hypothetical protein VFX89_01670 [Gammaproteobacteria bacterium]|nr:hypothetical protein [Gammaproteobacteria bacterium]